MIALTFDDGPSQWTEPILDLLEEHNVKATFFVVGQQIEGHEETIRRMHEQGCEVCNHTWSHANLEYLDIPSTVTELADCSQKICETGVPAPYFYRAPFLRDTPTARAAGAALGMVTVDADVIAFDWQLTDPEMILRNVMEGVKRGGEIVLLHDGVPSDRDGNRQPTVDALKELLPLFAFAEMKPQTISELLGRAGVQV